MAKRDDNVDRLAKELDKLAAELRAADTLGVDQLTRSTLKDLYLKITDAIWDAWRTLDREDTKTFTRGEAAKLEKMNEEFLDDFLDRTHPERLRKLEERSR